MITAQRLGASFSTISRALGLLERPAAVTENTVARLTHVAPYAPVSAPGSAFSVAPGHVTLRIDPRAVSGAYLVDGESSATVVPILRFHGHSDFAVHRCHPLVAEDRRMLRSLIVATPAAASDGEQPADQDCFDELEDQLGRIDALIVRTLPGAPARPHRHIDPEALLPLFERIEELAVQLGVGVFNPGVMQACQGIVDTITAEGGYTALRIGDATVTLDLDEVVSVLLIETSGAHGATTCLELFDAAHNRVAVLTQFGLVPPDDHRVWENLAALLPEL